MSDWANQREIRQLKAQVQNLGARLDEVERALAEQAGADHGNDFYAHKGPGGKWFVYQHGVRTGAKGYDTEQEALASAASFNEVTQEMRA